MKDDYSKDLDPFHRTMTTAALCCALSLASSAFIWDTRLAQGITAGWGSGAFAQVMGFWSIAFGTFIMFGFFLLIATLAWGVLLAPLRRSLDSKDWPDFFGYFLAIFFIFNSFTYALGPGGFDLSHVVLASWLIVILSGMFGYGLGAMTTLLFVQVLNFLD